MFQKKKKKIIIQCGPIEKIYLLYKRKNYTVWSKRKSIYEELLKMFLPNQEVIKQIDVWLFDQIFNFSAI